MPRDGAGNYYYPPGTPGIPDQTIESEKYNTFLDDLVTNELNVPLPVHRGGTGSNTADASLANLHGEKAEQVVTEYLSYLWLPGSFRSAAGATDAPVAGHTFSGICYINEPLVFPPTNANVTIEARDQNDTTTPGRKYIREKKAGTWGPWSISDSNRDQIVTNYDTHLFYPGSFRSATTAANSPVAGHSFAGFCYLNEAPLEPPTNLNFILEARDESGTEVPGILYVREKRAGAWTGPWTASGNNTIAGDIIINNGDVIANNGGVIVSNPVGTANEIHGQVTTGAPPVAKDRWVLVLGDGSVEDGVPANDGSNFFLRRYEDDGTLFAPTTDSDVLAFNRATAVGTFLKTPKAPTPVLDTTDVKQLINVEFFRTSYREYLSFLAGPVTYYVNAQTGSDGNDGSSATVVSPGKGPWKTIQQAVNFINERTDLRGGKAKIQLGNTATLYDGFTVYGPWVGGKGRDSVEVVGNLSTPSSCVIRGNGVPAVHTDGAGSKIKISGVSLTTTTLEAANILAGDGGEIEVGQGVRFGPCTSSHIISRFGSKLEVTENIEVYGSTTQGLFNGDSHGIIHMVSGRLVTITGAITFGQYLAYSNQLSYLSLDNIGFSGGESSAVQKYYAQANSIILAGTAISGWPGAAGTLNSGAVLL